ncbi:hypothetical protein [Pseudomonas aeruginosa]
MDRQIKENLEVLLQDVSLGAGMEDRIALEGHGATDRRTKHRTNPAELL